jgi:hypothetical protein
MIAMLGQKAKRHCCVRIAISAAPEVANLARLYFGDMDMATAGRAPGADSCFELGVTPSRRRGIANLACAQPRLDRAAIRIQSPTTRLWTASQISVAFEVVVACATALVRLSLLCVRPGAKALGSRPALVSRFLALSAISCAIAVAGCAQNSAQREVNEEPVHAAIPAQANPELRIRRPDRALLTPQPAPDCEFKASDLKTIDPDEWARLKVDFERQCYRHAEKIARDRLRRLQASNLCEFEPVRHSLATGPLTISPAAAGGGHQRRHS